MPAQKQKKQKTPWNAHRKAVQTANYEKQEKRKESRNKAQRERAKTNALNLIMGEPTPWMRVKGERKARRANRPA